MSEGGPEGNLLRKSPHTAGPQSGYRTTLPLAAGDLADTLLREKRLQTRQFRLTLRSLDGGKTFQIVKTQLIRAGKVYDFHYFCEICNITTYAPGPCMCCRAPTEYREAPAES